MYVTYSVRVSTAILSRKTVVYYEKMCNQHYCDGISFSRYCQTCGVEQIFTRVHLTRLKKVPEDDARSRLTVSIADGEMSFDALADPTDADKHYVGIIVALGRDNDNQQTLNLEELQRVRKELAIVFHGKEPKLHIHLINN